MTADQIRSLQPALAALLERFHPFFARETAFKHWHRYLAGLLAYLIRKSIEPIALAAGIPVRALQEFLAFFVWDEVRVSNGTQRLMADEHGCDDAVGAWTPRLTTNKARRPRACSDSGAGNAARSKTA